MASKDSLKQLKIVTGSVKRCVHRAASPTKKSAQKFQPASFCCRSSCSPAKSCAIISRGSLCKDLDQSAKEIASQEARIKQYEEDDERDEHDVKKQQEVLKEYTDGVLDEVNRLKETHIKLQSILVRGA